MKNGKQEIRTGERDFVLTRTFDAPRSLVFAAYSTCEHLSNWWGPRSWPMAECTMDFRVGGEWHYCLRGPNEGDESWGKAVFKEIVEPERIVYVDAFSDPQGDVNENMPRTESRIEFVDVSGKTRLTLRATYPTPADLQRVLDMGMEPGVTETLDRLDEYLASLVA